MCLPFELLLFSFAFFSLHLIEACNFLLLKWKKESPEEYLKKTKFLKFLGMPLVLLSVASNRDRLFWMKEMEALSNIQVFFSVLVDPGSIVRNIWTTSKDQIKIAKLAGVLKRQLFLSQCMYSFWHDFQVISGGGVANSAQKLHLSEK